MTFSFNINNSLLSALGFRQQHTAVTQSVKRCAPREGVGYSHIQAIWVCAAVKGMVFKQFSEIGYRNQRVLV